VFVLLTNITSPIELFDLLPHSLPVKIPFCPL
jgi:hypothetical protein